MSGTSVDPLEPEQAREELVRQRLARGGGGRRAGIPHADRAGRLPLSFGQERLWFLSMLDPTSAEYQNAMALRIRGNLVPTALTDAYGQLLRRHEVLRTRYQLLDARPIQVIDPPRPVELPVVDLSDLPEDQRELRALELARGSANEPFDLSLEHPLRVRLVGLAPDHHIMVWVFHHIAIDGWSQQVLIRELRALYLAAVRNGAADLPSLPIQYADFAVWQRDRLSGSALDRHLGYWREQLAGLTPLELPTDRPRPAMRSWVGDRVVFTVPTAVAEQVRALATARDTTVYTVILTAFQVLLSRYTGQRDVAVGSAMAGRGRPEVQDLVGFFLNTVVLRASWRGDPSFGELVDRNRTTVLDAVDHQEAPVQMLVDEIDPERDLSRTPVFQVMFDMAEAIPERIEESELTLEQLDPFAGKAKHDLRLEFAEHPDGELRGTLEFPTALFDRPSIERMAGCLGTLLAHVAADPDRRLSDLDVVDPTDRHRQLVEWSGATEQTPPAPVPVPEAIARRAAVEPDAAAVVAGSVRLSFAQLDARANQVAHQLMELQVGPESVVGVCLGRGPWLLPVLIGIWRTGGAYVPLDPADPPERLDYVLGDSGAGVVVTDTSQAAPLSASGSRRMLLIDAERPVIEARPDHLPDRAVDPDAAAYLIYTSGSTGHPKGVVVTHRALSSYLARSVEAYLSPGGNGAPLFSSVAFDLVVTTLYAPLLGGQPVHLLPQELGVGELGPQLAAASTTGEFSFVKLTPGHLELLVQQLDASQAPALADRVLVGGEGFSRQLAQRWWNLAGDRGATLVNEYGPTEVTVASTLFTADGPSDVDDDARLLPIGRPLRYTTAYVLDGAMRLLPTGAVGELYVGGGQLSRGYQGLPALTAERFLPDPYGPAGSRLYRTGDLARFLPTGDLMFLGRGDDQVKVRGYRVETAEIVAALRAHPEVLDAVVTVREGGGSRTLVAYLVGAGGRVPAAEELRTALARSLPSYMVPAVFVGLDRIPLTANGKTDYRALPDPDRESRALKVERVGPRDRVEEQLAAAWTAVLELDEVGVHDDFFDIGGDSLSAVALVGQLRETGLDLAVQDVFEHTTIAELAAQLADRPALAESAPKVAPFQLISEADRGRLPDQVQDAYPLSRLQVGMVYELLGGGDVHYYHNATTYTIHDDAPFSFPALQEAARVVVSRHEVLRTGFDLASYSEPLQLVHATAEMPVDWHDLRHLGRYEQEQEVRRVMSREREQLFDLGVPTLLRFFAHVRDEKTWLLTITECHAILEGWSYHLLLMELLNCYRRIRDTGAPEPAEPLQVRFADFIAAEREALTSADDRDYWRDVITGSTRLTLPPAWAAGLDESRDPYRLEVMFVDLEEGLQHLAKQAEVPLKSVMHAAHLKVMSMLTDAPEFYSGLVCDTRPEVAGAERLCGLFLNTVPFRFRRGAGTWRELAREVFAQEVEFWRHRRYPMPAMQRELAGGGRLLDVMFNYLDFRMLDMDLIGEAGIDDSPNEFPLAVTVFRQGMLNLRPHPDYISRQNGERLAAMYRSVLMAMAADPDGDARVTHLPTGEHRRILQEWNDTAVSWPPATLPELFDAQVAATPAATAVVTGDGEQLSFAELDRRANQLAHHLQSLGVGPEVLVGVCVEPGPELLVALLGVLKAGGAYVPLDPEHPTDRLAFALSDTAAPVVLTQERYWLELPSITGHVVCLDSEWDEIAGSAGTAPERVAGPDNLAYVMYTSGSTGLPKGVMISHQGLLNYLRWALAEYRLEGASGAPMLGSVAFDLPIPNFFLPLIGGADVTLLPPGRDLETLAGLLSVPHRDFSLIKATPAHLAMLRGSLGGDATIESARTIVVGGEAFPPRLARQWRELAPRARIINEYGPTETVVGCSVYEVPDDVDPTRPVPIGTPIANTRMYVLDEYLHQVPISAPGELYIAGDGVARGYLHRPDLTAERFVPDPYSPTPGARCYRSGDRAYFRSDGNLHFLDRADHQLKIRGFRIEPGEIEASLVAHPDVAEAVVVAAPDPSGGKRLVGYLVGAAGRAPDAAAVRQSLRDRLPEYMIPSMLMTLDELPRSSAGKIDRGKLPPPEGTGPQRLAEYVAPQTVTERGLADIWARVLGVERIGLHDDVLDLGADSLSGIRVAVEAKELGLSMSPMDVLTYPTVAELANHLVGGSGTELLEAMHRDAALEPEIAAGDTPPARSDAPVLLTGATGFVGAFLLHELLNRTDLQVYCLVSGDSDEAAAQRLRESLQRWEVYRPEWDDRLHVVAGDLASPRFGLDHDRFDSLAQTVGAIYHSGAMVNAVYPYRAMRSVNVEGTREILRLACTHTVKHVHQVSTMSVFQEAELLTGTVADDSEPFMASPDHSSGYAQSKWVAEVLIQKAGSRGIPTTIYRMGKVSWHSGTGVYNPNDVVTHIVETCLVLGTAPDLEYAMTLTPVDRVAAGIVTLGTQPTSVGRAFHVVSPYRTTWRQMVEWMNTSGQAVEMVDFTYWRDQVRALAEGASGERFKPLVLFLPGEDDSSHFEDELPNDYVPPQATLWERIDSGCPPVDRDMVGRFASRLAERERSRL